MRSFIFAAAISSCCISAAQDTSTHVTYFTRASRASQVLKELGKLAKVDLQASPQNQNDVLVISVKDLPLKDVMTRIALATSGDWKQEGSTYRLVASTIIRKQEDREESAKRTAKVRKAINSRLTEEKKALDEAAKAELATKKGNKADTTAKKKTADEIAADAIEAFGQRGTPEESAITALLADIDPSVLAQIDEGDRIVFSTDPTRMQRSLGGGATEIINNLIQRHDSNVGDKKPDLNDALGGMTEQQADMVRQMMRRQNTGKIGAVAKALLIASNASSGSFLNSDTLGIELRLYDAKGKVVFTSTSNLQFDDDNVMQKVMAAAATAAAARLGTPTNKPEVDNSKKTPIEYSADSKALQESVKGMMVGKWTVQLKRELRQKLFLPNLYDPLSFGETDQVLSYAKYVGKPLVANIPDSASEGIQPFGDGNSTTVESFAEDLKKAVKMQIVQDEAFTVLKPAFPVRARAERLDRLALAALLQATQEKGIPTLDDLANYAAVSPNPMAGGVGSLYLFLFVPGGMPMGFDGMQSWDMLKFYSQLTPDARASLLNGGKIPLGALSGLQRTAVERMIYGAGAQLSIEDPQKKPSEDVPAWMSMMGGGSSAEDYRGEPTEVVPNGLPGTGYLEMKGTSEPFAAPMPTGDTSTMAMLGVLGPDELALFKMLRTSPGAEQLSGMFPKFPQLRVGERSVMKFSFHLAPLVSIQQTLKDNRLGKDAALYSEDGLPADLQKRVAARTEALKKSPFGAIGSFMGGAQGIHP